MKTSMKIARAAVVALGLSLALGVASAAEAQGQFTFRGAEFNPSGEPLAAAQAFVTEQLPAGLPIPEAIRRLRKAGAFCAAHQPANAQLTCRFSILQHPTGLELGAVNWTIRLSQDSQGLLAKVAVERSTTV